MVVIVTKGNKPIPMKRRKDEGYDPKPVLSKLEKALLEESINQEQEDVVITPPVIEEEVPKKPKKDK